MAPTGRSGGAGASRARRGPLLLRRPVPQPGQPRRPLTGTGPEIWSQTGGRVTHLVAGLGTTGTLMGIGRYLKARKPSVELVAVQPAESFHGIEGLKHLPTAIVPDIYDETVPDRQIGIDTDAAFDLTRALAKSEGLFAGDIHRCGAGRRDRPRPGTGRAGRTGHDRGHRPRRRRPVSLDWFVGVRRDKVVILSVAKDLGRRAAFVAERTFRCCFGAARPRTSTKALKRQDPSQAQDDDCLPSCRLLSRLTSHVSRLTSHVL